MFETDAELWSALQQMSRTVNQVVAASKPIAKALDKMGDVASLNRQDYVADALNGDRSGFKSDIGYIGQHTHVIDMNEVVNHFGKHTESEINVAGALRDGAKKIFRGTIDFKTGAADSVGNEQETVRFQRAMYWPI